MSTMMDSATGTTNQSTELQPAAPGHAVFDEEQVSLFRRGQQFLHGHPTMIPLLVLVLGIAGFSLTAGSRFYAPYNFSLILQQVTIIGTIGVGQTLIVLTAGIDLSVGAIMVITSVIMGRFAVDFGMPVYLAMACGLLAGGIAGAINGILVTLFRLPPFIVTLGTWSIYLAMDLYFSESKTIRSQDVEAVASPLQWLGTPFDFYGARPTYGSIAMILLVCVFWYILNRTAFGRHIYATGDDEEAARLAGIRTNRILLGVYTIAGLICAFGGWQLIGRVQSVTPLAGGTSNLDSITAVVIGGTSLFGGRGSIFGTLIGALIVGMFRNGLVLAGADVLWQEFTIGLLIIVAVAIDQWIRRVAA
jgi:fructose transport system permease protein